MATDPRDPRFLDALRQFGEDDHVTWSPRINYGMTGALNPQSDMFSARGGHQVFFKVKEDKRHPIIIPERLKEPLNAIGEEFFYRTGLPVTVNSGFRKPAEQAELMYDAFEGGRDGYRRPGPADELRFAFAHGKRSGVQRAVTERYMAEIIGRQVAKNLFVSDHLRRNAADFSDKGISTHRQLLQSIVKKHGHSPLFHDGHLHTSFRLRK